MNKNGHKIFTNVSTVFKNKRRKGCSRRSSHVNSARQRPLLQWGTMYMWGDVSFLWFPPRSCRFYVTPQRNVGMNGGVSFFFLFLVPCRSELMAAVRIHGFDNGQRSNRQFTRRVYLHRNDMRASQTKRLRGTERVKTILIHELKSIYGVQSSDSERLEQPLLTSFVQAGNINSS